MTQKVKGWVGGWGGTEHGAHFVITQYTIKIQTKIGEGEAQKNPILRHIGTEKQRAPSLDMTRVLGVFMCIRGGLEFL